MAAIEDPGERLGAALSDFYAYYRRTEGMMDKLLRDEATVEVVNELMGAYRAMLDQATEILMKGRGLRGNAAKRTRAAIGHALAFRTWQDLTGAQGLDDKGTTELMLGLIATAG